MIKPLHLFIIVRHPPVCTRALKFSKVCKFSQKVALFMFWNLGLRGT